MHQPNYSRTKHTCYYTYVAMSSIFSLPPLLFITFHEMYDISYTLLGTLVLINFCTQLIIDLIFSFFSKYFDVKKTLRVMPLLTSLGLLIYAIVPMIAPGLAYLGLAVGTVIFSLSAGLSEVLLSPTVAALPSKTPERDMSILHSLYAYGVLLVVIVSSLYLTFVGTEHWMYLAMFWAVLPLISCFLFFTSPVPDYDVSNNSGEKKTGKKSLSFILFIACIFFGSAAENAMTNWVSSYVESVLGLTKIWGNIGGMALFAVLLGLARSLYAKYGKNISRVLMLGMIGAVVCYLTTAFSSNLIISLIACVFTGFCTSMLWPGPLISMEEKFPNPGIAAYALMAAGGDLGASVTPQLLGIIVDTVAATGWAKNLGSTLALTPEQIGMKIGMLTAAIFPTVGIGVLIAMKKRFKKA